MVKQLALLRLVTRSLLVVLLAACGVGGETECERDQVAVDPAGGSSGWVVDQVLLPTSANQAQTYGLNIDCDPHRYPDNAIGQILSALDGSHSSIDLNQTMAGLIGDGRLLHLLSVQATSVVDADGVGVLLMHGLDQDGDPADNLLGGETFAVDTAAGQGLATGQVSGGHLWVRGGELPIGLTLPGLDEVLIVSSAAARIEAAIEGDRIEGRIGGALSGDTVDNVLVPFGQVGLMRAVDRDCTGTTTGAPPCGCVADSFGELALDLFDELPRRADPDRDGDCVIEVDELRNNSLISSLLTSDVDLFDADGRYSPRTDGVEDGLSFGLWFSAVPAVIQR